MGVETKIPWCHHTWNPWRGCVHVSEGCVNCYAETLSHRNPAVLGEWGAEARRVVGAEPYWRLPHRWNLDARVAGVRRRVFALSLGDWLEMREDLHRPRARLLGTIAATPDLDWLLLTKRPENWRSALGHAWRVSPAVPGACASRVADWLDGKAPANVWLGVSAETRRWYRERTEHLRSIPAAIRFVSAEPLLGDLVGPGRPDLDLAGIDWLILGGESGPDDKVRPCQVCWIRRAVEECRRQGCPPYVKQLGGNIVDSIHESVHPWDSFPGTPKLTPTDLPYRARVHLAHPRGEDPAEWPEDVRIREFPAPAGDRGR